MRLRETARLAVEALLAHKFRTALTMLGMVIGVFSVVLLVSLGQGAKNYVTSEFQSLGTNFIVIQPGKADKRGMMGPPVGATARKMTLMDVAALEKKAFNLDAVSGLILGAAEARYADAVSNIQVFGANDQFPKILSIKVGLGDFFTREEDDYGRRVCVLGSKVAANLFGDENPVGRAIKLNQSEFRVIGVLATRGNTLGLDLDNFGFIPTTAAMRLFNEDKLFGIRARSSSRVSLDDAVAEISEILRERRNGQDDFTIITQVTMLQTMETILNMLTYVLAGIAAISMLVGGIGIMNIMLVSVSERTQEIGIRRAVGARRRDILKQFLAEAVMLSVLSGALGLLGALGVTVIASQWVGSFDMTAPSWILLPAFSLSVIVGVVFGVWPARKASRIETLDALRYE